MCVVCLSAGMASLLEVEDEPEERDAFNSLHEHARLEELARRNTLCLPHLRSVYPLEVFSTDSGMVAAHAKDTSSSDVAGQSSANTVEGHMKDVSKPGVESQTKEGSRSSLVGGHTKYLPGSSVIEGHFKDISRSNVVDGQSRSRPSSAVSLPPQSELISQENINRRKVNTITMTTVIIIPPAPPLDNIRVMVIVWRLRGNIIRTAPCWVV